MPITAKQRRVYEFIKRYIESNDEPPTIAEIGKHFLDQHLNAFILLLDFLTQRMIVAIYPVRNVALKRAQLIRQRPHLRGRS